MPTKEDLKYFQAMPLDIKVAMAKTRIREWVNHYGESGTYISFSGGKDSTVLLHLVRSLYPDIPAVFVNTGLEYPEIQAFVKTIHKYEKIEGRVAFVGTLAEESLMREAGWIKNGCNAFESNPPKSQPMSFWKENDVLQYIVENDLKICSVYGDIIKADKNNQLCMINDICSYRCSNTSRTGCIFCGFGAQCDTYSRFKLLKQTHPKQYNYCISGGEYDINGLWKPNGKGLGMGHVLDVLNELYSKNGKTFIEY